MKGLITLIKLHSRTLDELRRKMVSLENQKEQLLQLSQRLKDELASEIQLASKSPEMGRFFGDFSKRMKARQADIAKEVEGLDKQMKDLNVKIVEAFSEVKKYEIALENANKRAQAETDRRESATLDDAAAQQYNRKRKKEEQT